MKISIVEYLKPIPLSILHCRVLEIQETITKQLMQSTSKRKLSPSTVLEKKLLTLTAVDNRSQSYVIYCKTIIPWGKYISFPVFKKY